MTVQPTATTYAGVVTVTLGGAERTLRFGMNTMRTYTEFTGTPAGQIVAELGGDLYTNMPKLVYCAIKRYVPANELPKGFSLDHTCDWIEEMSQADGDRLAATILDSLRTANPLTAALVTKLQPLTPDPSAGTDGRTSSTSPSAS